MLGLGQGEHFGGDCLLFSVWRGGWVGGWAGGWVEGGGDGWNELLEVGVGWVGGWVGR